MESSSFAYSLTITDLVELIITWGFLDAPMIMAECKIILKRLHTIGGMSLWGSAWVGLEAGSPRAWPVFVLSFLEIHYLNRSCQGDSGLKAKMKCLVANWTERGNKQGIIQEKLNTISSSHPSETVYSPKNLCCSPPNTLPQSGQVLFSIGFVHYSRTTTTRKCALRASEGLIRMTTKIHYFLFLDKFSLKPATRPKTSLLSKTNALFL